MIIEHYRVKYSKISLNRPILSGPFMEVVGLLEFGVREGLIDRQDHTAGFCKPLVPPARVPLTIHCAQCILGSIYGAHMVLFVVHMWCGLWFIWGWILW